MGCGEVSTQTWPSAHQPLLPPPLLPTYPNHQPSSLQKVIQQPLPGSSFFPPLCCTPQRPTSWSWGHGQFWSCPLAPASPAGAAPLSAAAETPVAYCGPRGSACVSPGGSCAAEGCGPRPEAPHCGGPVLPQQSPQPGWAPRQPPHAATSGASALPGESCPGERSQDLWP